MHFHRMYLLKQSWSRRDLVSNSCILSSLLWLFHVYFTLSLRGGVLSFDFLNKTDSILRKAHKFGYTTKVLKVTDMLQNADNKLFSLMFRCGHCLYTRPQSDWHCPPYSSGTSFNLPHCSYKPYCSRLSIDVFFATAIDMFYCILHFVFHIHLILFDLLSFSPCT